MPEPPDRTRDRPAEQPPPAVRLPSISDLVEITRVHSACFPRPRSQAWTDDAWRRQIADPHVLAYVVNVDAHTLAGVLLARRAGDEAEILTLAVDPPRRRQGIARTLLSRLTCELARNLPCRLFLEVSVENVAAIALYRSCGFATVAKREGYYRSPGRHPIDAYVLVCEMG